MRRPTPTFTFIHTGLCVSALGAISMALHVPLVIPAVGASAYVVLAVPNAELAAPRNVLVGHGLGAFIGWLMLAAFGLSNVVAGFAHDLGWTRIVAAACALALTSATLILLKCSHPPAGATTLIVATGVLPELAQVLDFELSALVVVIYASIACRAAGYEYPLWHPRSPVKAN